MSVRKSSHGTIFVIVSSGSPRARIASSLRSTSKKPFCPTTRSLHPPMTACGHRVRFVATWREEFFEVPLRLFDGAGFSCKRHGEFRVAGSVFKESRARTRQQWENALVLAERRAALGTRPLITTYDF